MYGILYNDIRLKENAGMSPQDRIVWLYQFCFLLRRSIFMTVTVFLFDCPSMQMLVH